MRVGLYLSLLAISVALCSAEASDIRVRVGSDGKKIYYNIPSPSLNSASPSAVAYSRRVEEFLPIIQETCSRHGVDPELVKALIQVESNYNHLAVSRKGAMGLMQLMPATASRYGVKSAFDPHENVDGGVRYLKDLLELFGDKQLALAAYNAGEGAVQRVNGIPDYVETQNYVRKVLALYNGDATYTPVSTKPRMVTYYKYLDNKGVTHYASSPVLGMQTERVSFYY
jgi:soluble lytic murein transglycosylase-like protein